MNQNKTNFAIVFIWSLKFNFPLLWLVRVIEAELERFLLNCAGVSFVLRKI